MAEYLFGGIFFVLGVIFFIIGFTSTKRAQAAQTWPTVPGEIIRSDIVQHTDYDSDNSPSTSYEPVVQYTYSIMGQVMTGARIAFGANQFNYKKALEISGKYPVGTRVIVHYNPDKVNEATLETAARGGKAFTIIGIVELVVGVIATVAVLISG